MHILQNESHIHMSIIMVELKDCTQMKSQGTKGRNNSLSHLSIKHLLISQQLNELTRHQICIKNEETNEPGAI